MNPTGRARRRPGSADAAPAAPPPSPEERAREVCLAALERRMHSRRELEQKLRRKGIGEDVTAAVLDRLTEVGLVDDLAFARAFVASRQRRRPRGARGLEADLGARGVPAEIVRRVLVDLRDEEDPREAAARALAPKLRALRGRPRDEARRKAADHLIRRGFAWDVVRQAIDAALAAEDEDDGTP